MPRKEFDAFTRLDASDINTFLMDQAVMTFAGTAARGSAIGTATEGMLTYLADTDTFEFWDGTEYQTFGGPDVITVDYLIIGGGGGGGQGIGGGGGAGGYQTSVGTTGGGGTAIPALILNKSTNYPVRVGAGGSGGTGSYPGATRGDNGSPSQFILYSVGGGGGGAWNTQQRGIPGASGGGGAFETSAGSVFVGQGFAGASGISGAGGGGGGASASPTDQNGANGISSDITGSSVTRAGGGGGGAEAGVGTPGTGGTGGGGAGGNTGQLGTSGTVNTGGGGGGSANSLTGTAGSGGSGLVVLRYPSALTITIGAGLTGSTATDGDYEVTTITAGTGNVSWA
jgi:hypothetical protein